MVTVGMGVRVCTRTCLDELQENGQRTIIIGPDPAPLRNPRPALWTAQAAQDSQYVTDDVGATFTDDDANPVASDPLPTVPPQ
jgi:hypothetical protein